MRIEFSATLPVDVDTVVVAAETGGKLVASGAEFDEAHGGVISRAIDSARQFTGSKEQLLSVTLPGGTISRAVVIGIDSFVGLSALDRQRLGGATYKYLCTLGAQNVAIPTNNPVEVCDYLLGNILRSYRFDNYRTTLKPEDRQAPEQITVVTADATQARKRLAELQSLADGVFLTRDLVSEPANTLYPEEFARRAMELAPLGVDVEVLDEAAMQELGMGALLGVGQGSEKESQLVVMRWQGASEDDPWLAVVGKGVCFDTGGISLKPGAGMEEMKFDMAGAGCVTGLMKVLASRKAKANVVGVLGCVENMPSHRAQRPGDVVTTMSGQTIEVINTDAEGRLVLADALHYTVTRFKPSHVIDLATLTGAIIVAIGSYKAGLFSNDDDLADTLIAAGDETGEELWRMPLGERYDKDINSDIADMKNVGLRREAGATAGAVLLQRFVGDTPWAHLDIAGVAWARSDDAITPKGASGYGVRLLDNFIASNREPK